MTFGICFRIHTPRLRRTPLREGTRGGGPSVVTLWNIERHERHELGGLSGYKWHGGSVPF